jgi:hypothetical protein
MGAHFVARKSRIAREDVEYLVQNASWCGLGNFIRGDRFEDFLASDYSSVTRDTTRIAEVPDDWLNTGDEDVWLNNMGINRYASLATITGDLPSRPFDDESIDARQRVGTIFFGSPPEIILLDATLESGRPIFGENLPIIGPLIRFALRRAPSGRELNSTSEAWPSSDADARVSDEHFMPPDGVLALLAPVASFFDRAEAIQNRAWEIEERWEQDGMSTAEHDPLGQVILTDEMIRATEPSIVEEYKGLWAGLLPEFAAYLSRRLGRNPTGTPEESFSSADAREVLWDSREQYVTLRALAQRGFACQVDL